MTAPASPQSPLDAVKALNAALGQHPGAQAQAQIDKAALQQEHDELETERENLVNLVEHVLAAVDDRLDEIESQLKDRKSKSGGIRGLFSGGKHTSGSGPVRRAP